MDLHGYEFLVLRGGTIRCRVLGLISPRPDELEAIITQSVEQIRRGQQIAHDAKMRANENVRRSARLLGDPWWR